MMIVGCQSITMMQNISVFQKVGKLFIRKWNRVYYCKF